LKPRAAHEHDGAAITRLDVRLDAVEPERAEGLPEHERERLRHVAPPRMGRADLVAEIPAAEDAAYDLVDVDATHEGVVGRPADEIARGVGPPPPGQIGGPLTRGHRRHHPAAVEAPARAVEAQELVAVRAARGVQVDPAAAPRDPSHAGGLAARRR